MSDFVSKVLTLFKVDTSDMKAGLKELTGEEKKLAQAQLDRANSTNKQYDDWIGSMGKANQALELVNKAVGFAKDAFKAYSEDLRLRAAAGAADIEKLKAASLGLRTEHELLTFAAQVQHGAFKLNSDQMATAQKAMVALTRAGFDQEEVTKKVTDALVKANGGGLDDFGILLKQGKTDAENFNNVMDALAVKAAGVDESTGTAGEGVQRMGVSMAESVDKMKRAVGELVVALEPLLTALASAVGLVADIAGSVISEVGMKWDPRANIEAVESAQRQAGSGSGMWDRKFGTGGGPNTYNPYANENPFSGEYSFKTQDYNRMDQGQAGALDVGKFQGALTGLGGVGKKYDRKYNGKSSKSDPAIAEAAKDRADLILAEFEEANKIAMERMEAGTDAHTDVSNILQANMASGMLGIPDDAAFQEALAGAMAMGEEARERLYQDMNTRQSESFMESTFGKIEEVNYYQEAFAAFGNAVGSSFEAIVTGSEGAGAAFKKMLADSLMSIGKESAIRALQETAYAFGSLAWGNVPSATAHFKAAAMHGGVAIAAGLAANQIGTSSQAAANDKAAADKAREDDKAKKEQDKRAGGGRGGSNGGSDGDGKTINVFFGDYMNGDERRRRQVADEAIQRALRERDN